MADPEHMADAEPQEPAVKLTVPEPLPKEVPARPDLYYPEGIDASMVAVIGGGSAAVSVPGFLSMLGVFDLPEHAPAASFLLGGAVAAAILLSATKGSVEDKQLMRTRTGALEIEARAVRRKAKIDATHTVTVEKDGIGAVIAARSRGYLRRAALIEALFVLLILGLLAALAALSVVRTVSGPGEADWVREIETALEGSPVIDAVLQYGAALYAGALLFVVGAAVISMLAWAATDDDDEPDDDTRAGRLMVLGVTAASAGAVHISTGTGVVLFYAVQLLGGFALLLPLGGLAAVPVLLTALCCAPRLGFIFGIVAYTGLVLLPILLVCAASCPELTLIGFMMFVLLLARDDTDIEGAVTITVVSSASACTLQYARVALLLLYRRPSPLYWALAGGTTDSAAGPLALEALLLLTAAYLRWQTLTTIESQYPGDEVIEHYRFGWFSFFEAPLVPIVALHKWLYAPVHEAADKYFAGEDLDDDNDAKEAGAEAEEADGDVEMQASSSSAAGLDEAQA